MICLRIKRGVTRGIEVLLYNRELPSGNLPSRLCILQMDTVWHTSWPDNVEDVVNPQIILEGHPSAFVPDENTPLALFGAFLMDSMLEDVVKYTNMKIEIFRSTIGPANRRSSTYQLIDLMDLKAIIGMLIFSGSKKDSHVRTLDMFST